MHDTILARTSALLGTALGAILAACPAMAQQVEPEARDPDEIVVYATKRAEVVREIPGSVTAMSGEQLDRIGADSMGDYLTRTPGVVFNAATPGDSSVVIRGVATTTGHDQGQATTGYFINEVPLTDPTFSIGTPDIDTFDVDNVAILRGPQGTLFGSSSLGGAVNYQAAKPDLDALHGRAQGTVRTTEHGGTGWAGKYMINLPIIQGVLGVRGVFVYRKDAGFIDNIGTGRRDSNATETLGGRVLATWRPGADTTVNYLYLEQTTETPDVGYQQTDVAGELQKNTFLPDRANFRTLIHNLRIDQDLSFATLTATATYHRKWQESETDFTDALSSDLFGLQPISSASPGTSRGKTFEIRLASAPGGRLDYVIGAMHDDTKMRNAQIIHATGLADLLDVAGPLLGLPEGAGQTIAPNDLVVDARLPTRSHENAVFGEATYHLNDQFKATLGGRLFDQKITNETNAFGLISLLNSGELVTRQSGTQKAHGFNPKASITWTPNRDIMTYALVSKGFRFGGPNIVPPLPGSNIPSQYGSDSLWNYEVGARADLLDRHLLLDVTAFYIDWSDIQLRLNYNSLSYADNAGKARIKGIEASATLRIADGLRANSNATYLDASLADPFDQDPSDPANAIVPRGSRLPGASKWQVSNLVSYDWASGPLRPSITLSHRYISRASGNLISGTPQGGYHLFDARIGLQAGRFDLTLFADNIGNSRGVITGSTDPLQQYVVRPRTFGVTVDLKL